MSRIFAAIGLALLGTFIIYSVISFIQFDPDIRAWPAGGRALAVIFAVLWAALVVHAYGEE